MFSGSRPVINLDFQTLQSVCDMKLPFNATTFIFIVFCGTKMFSEGIVNVLLSLRPHARDESELISSMDIHFVQWIPQRICMWISLIHRLKRSPCANRISERHVIYFSPCSGFTNLRRRSLWLINVSVDS